MTSSEFRNLNQTEPAPPRAEALSRRRAPCEDRHPLAEDLKQWSGLVEGRKFVWLLAPPWDGVWTRQNHFATRLARLGAEVLYVENPSSLSSNLKQKKWKDIFSERRGAVRQIEPRLHVMRTGFTLPGSKRSNVVARFNGRGIASRINEWTRINGWTDAIAWCRIPYSLFALAHLQPATIVYDITDDYELYESDGRNRAVVKTREQELLSRADMVFITAKELQTKENLKGRCSHWIPNGVEFDLFAQASEPGEIHPLVAGMRQPVIGYVGLTSHWMDFELLEMLGRRWPGQILMLGPIASQVAKRAKAIPGIVWGGFVRQPELPPYLRGFDVCIMPHLVNELRQKSNPLKIWEYLATGRPFVSVDLPALEPAREFVDVARDRHHFVELVDRRLRSLDGYRSAAAQALAKDHSWDSIFHQAMTHLEPLCPQPGRY